MPQARVVNYYNWSDYEDPTVLEAFTKETGITEIGRASCRERVCLAV